MVYQIQKRDGATDSSHKVTHMFTTPNVKAILSRVLIRTGFRSSLTSSSRSEWCAPLWPPASAPCLLSPNSARTCSIADACSDVGDIECRGLATM